MTFTLIGMPGCGKSCMARSLSRKLKMKYIDGDKLIERTFGKRLWEIIGELGVEGFKEIEEKTLLSINDDNAIIAPGGSSVYYPSVMEHCKKLGKIIYLYCSYEVIEQRLGDFSKRGVVLKENQTLRDLYDERCALYRKYADITVDCSGIAFPKYQARVINAINMLYAYSDN